MNLAILQARLSSSRLPGKVLRPIVGQPMMALQIERLLRAKSINKLVVATSDNTEDDAIASLCQQLGVSCYQGNLDNVLDRFYQVVKQYNPDHIIRLTADCPLACPYVIDEVVNQHIKLGNSYTSNAIEHHYLDGLDVEVMTREALIQAWQNSTTPLEKEHVTPYIIERPDLFKASKVKSNQEHSKHRWTVDYPQDFELVEFVYQTLYANNPQFSTEDVLTLLAKNPEIYELNQQYIE